MSNSARISPLVYATALAFCLLAGSASARLDPFADAEDRLDPASPVLLQGAVAKSAPARARTALAYGRMQRPEGIDPLLVLARDSLASVRREAIFALGQMAWRTEFAQGREAEIAVAVASHLGERDPRVRLAAIEAIGKIGLERAPEWLAPLLGHRSAKARAQALMALFRYRYVIHARDSAQAAPALPADIVARMAPLVRDRNTEVRRNLAYGFARFKDARGLSLCLPLLEDKDVWTRLFAVNALARIADASAYAPVQRRFGDSDPRVRRAAVQAVAALGNPGAAAGLRDDADVHVRSAVAETLGAVRDNQEAATLVTLRGMAADGSAEVRSSAYASLGRRLGAGAFGDLEIALGDSDPVVRAAAISATQYSNTEQRHALILRTMDDSSAWVRRAVIEARAGEAGDEAFDFLSRQLDSHDPDILEAAVTALGSRTEARAVDLAWQAYLTNPDSGSKVLREAAATAMAKLKGEASNAHLRDMLADTSFTVGMIAYEALLARGFANVARPPETPSFSPYRGLRTGAHPVVTLKTTRGVIRLRLDYAQAPVHVANFVGLVKSRFFDGKIWLRVVPNFVIQGGAPSAWGGASQSYYLRAEINSHRFERGAVGMSRAGLFNTGDSQLFVTQVLAPHLDGQYTWFGRVARGISVLDRIELGDKILSARVAD